MKTRKILSLITVLALMLSVVALPVYAAPDPTSKISFYLKCAIKEAKPNEKFRVRMMTIEIDDNTARRIAEEESGTNELEIENMRQQSDIPKDEQDRIVDNYYKCLNKTRREMYDKIVDAAFAAGDITEEETILRGVGDTDHILEIGVDKIYKLIESKQVYRISLAPLRLEYAPSYRIFEDGEFFNGASAGKGVKLEDGKLVGGADGGFTVNISGAGRKDPFNRYLIGNPGLIHIEGELIPKKGVTMTTSSKTYIQFGENGTKELISDIAYCCFSADVPDYSFPRVGKYGYYYVTVDNTFDFDGNSFTLINDDFDFKISSIFLSVGRQVLPAGRLSEPEPDVKSTAIGQTASSLNDGDSTKLYTTIRNSGEDGFYEGSLEISFTVDGKVIDTVTYDKRIEVGESVTVKSNKDWKASFGAHTVKAVIKPSEKAFAKASSIKERTNVTDN